MEELELIQISLGKKFPLFEDSTKSLIGQDGAVFEASDFNQGYMLCIYNLDLQFMEIQNYKNSKIQMRILQGNDGMVIPLMKFGKSNVIYEMVFDPTKYEDERALQFIESNNMILIYIIESRNGVLKYIRQCNFPLKFIQMCKEAWARAFLDLNFSEKYSEWVDKTRKYDLVTLWNRATPVGVLGETYDLHDIQTPYVKE